MIVRVAVTGDEAAVRKALARALAIGGVAGSVTVADGVARFELPTVARELVRVGQAVVAGAASSVGVAIWCGWMFHRALPVGGVVALAWAALGILVDRRRLAARARALVAALPVLLD